MNITESILIGLALAMDCFTVSIASGALVKKVVVRPMLTMILLFGIFQGGMTLAGWRISSIFSHILAPIDHWIAFALLGYLGGRMIYESNKKEEECKFNPLNYRVILTLSVATSIDAMAVGVSMAFMKMNSWNDVIVPSAIITLLSSLLTLCGLGTGVILGKKIPFKMELLGGLILLGIGIKILIEHLS